MLGGLFSIDARSDVGWITSATLEKAALIAIAGINTAAAIKIADKQYDIAKKYWRIAQDLHDWWLNVYKPREQQLMDWVWNNPDSNYEPQYDKRAGQFVANVNEQWKDTFDEIPCLGNRYCLGLKQEAYKDALISWAIARGDATNFAYEYEIGRADAKRDVFFSRVHTMLALERGLIAAALSYAQSAMSGLGHLGSEAGEGAGSALASLGWVSHRQNQPVPQQQPYMAQQSRQTKEGYMDVATAQFYQNNSVHSLTNSNTPKTVNNNGNNAAAQSD